MFFFTIKFFHPLPGFESLPTQMMAPDSLERASSESTTFAHFHLIGLHSFAQEFNILNSILPPKHPLFYLILMMTLEEGYIEPS